MPITYYHFGPSGFIGLIFKKWIDLPVFLLVNIVVDVEVLVIVFFDLGYPVHRYAHTLLIGGLVGALAGLAMYPLKKLFKLCMKILHLNYQTSLLKMIISGILGIWFHNLIDGIDHWDVRLLWPFDNKFSLWRMYFRHVNDSRIENICTIFIFLAMFVYFIIMAIQYIKNKKTKAENPAPDLSPEK